MNFNLRGFRDAVGSGGRVSLHERNMRKMLLVTVDYDLQPLSCSPPQSPLPLSLPLPSPAPHSPITLPAAAINARGGEDNNDSTLCSNATAAVNKAAATELLGFLHANQNRGGLSDVVTGEDDSSLMLPRTGDGYVDVTVQGGNVGVGTAGEGYVGVDNAVDFDGVGIGDLDIGVGVGTDSESETATIETRRRLKELLGLDTTNDRGGDNSSGGPDARIAVTHVNAGHGAFGTGADAGAGAGAVSRASADYIGGVVGGDNAPAGGGDVAHGVRTYEAASAHPPRPNANDAFGAAPGVGGTRGDGQTPQGATRPVERPTEQADTAVLESFAGSSVGTEGGTPGGMSSVPEESRQRLMEILGLKF